jgi:hypothetical protein
MPISLKELKSLKAELTVPLFEGLELNIVYKVDAFDDDLSEKLNAASTGGMAEKTKGYREILGRVLISWDLEDDKGKVLPVNADTLKHFNFDTLDTILGAILRDNDPKLIRTASSPRLQAVE